MDNIKEYIPEELRVLDNVFGRIAQVLGVKLKSPVFFAVLRPDSSTAQYFGTTNTAQPDPETGEIMRKFLDENPINSVEQIGLVRWPEELMKDASVRQSAAAYCLRSSKPRYEDASHPTLMEEAIKKDIGVDVATDYLNPLQNGKVVYRKDGYFSESSGIVSPNLTAEFLYHSEGKLPDLKDAQNVDKLSHFLLPLHSLCQAKAVACWFGEKRANLDEAFKQTLNALLSQASIEAFLLSLDEVLTTSNTYETHKMLTTAFAKLWWSQDIVLRNKGQVVFSKSRDSNGDLLEQQDFEVSSNQHSVRHIEVFSYTTSYDEDIKEDITEITVCFEALIRSQCPENEEFGNLDCISIEDVRELLGCDHISIRARKVTFPDQYDDNKNYFKSITAGLSLHLYTNIKAHHYRRVASEKLAVGDSWHFQKTVVESTGWRKTLEFLEKHDEDIDNGELKKRLYQTLGSMEYAEGLGLLSRLVAVNERGNLDKLIDWRDSTSRAIWKLDKTEVQTSYEDWINSYAFRVLNGRDEEIDLISVKEIDGVLRGSIVTNPTFKSHSSMKWPSEKEGPPSLLPPFSVANGAEPARTILSSLYEPLFNAIKRAEGLIFTKIAVKNFGSPEQYVEVLIGNGYEGPISPQDVVPNGIRQTQSFFAASQLATYGELHRRSSSIQYGGRNIQSEKFVWFEIKITPGHLMKLLEEQCNA